MITFTKLISTLYSAMWLLITAVMFILAVAVVAVWALFWLELPLIAAWLFVGTPINLFGAVWSAFVVLTILAGVEKYGWRIRRRSETLLSLWKARA